MSAFLASRCEVIQAALTLHDELQRVAFELTRERDRAVKPAAALSKADQEEVRETVKGIRVELDRAAEQARYAIRGLDSFARQLRELGRLDGLIVGWFDDVRGGEPWYISRGWCFGRLAKTTDPEYAALFADVEAVERWVTSLKTSKGRDENGKHWPAPLAQLSGRRLFAFRVSVAVEKTPWHCQVPQFGAMG